MSYIYKITNIINGKSYIGKTNYSIEKRFKEHCKDSQVQSKNKRPLYMAMRKYGVNNFKIELLEETDNPDEREIFWIKKINTFKYGYNATIGGDGKSFIDYNLVINTYKSKQNQNETAKALNLHPSTVYKILRNSNVVKYSNQDVNTKKYGKKIKQIDLNGNIVNIFNSIREASRYMVENQLTNCKLDTIKTHISEVCKGKRKTASKFRWEYA